MIFVPVALQQGQVLPQSHQEAVHIIFNTLKTIYRCQATLCMIWVAYLTAIGYGIDEAVWINVDETPVPYHVGGRHGWKKKKTSGTGSARPNGRESIFAIEEVALYSCGKHCFE